MNFFTALDYMGTKPTLFINSKSSYKTTLGGVLSTIYYICLVMGASYFLKLLIGREIYNVSTSEEFYPDSFANWTDLEFSLVLLNDYGLPFPEQDRIYSVSAMWMRWERYIKPDNTKGAFMNMVPIKLDKCNLTKHYEDASLWNSSNYVNLSYCTETNQNFNLSKSMGDINFSMVNFWVVKCTNSTVKNDCFPAEKIENFLSNSNVALRFKNYYFDHKKTKDIGMPYIFRDTSIGSSSLYRILKYTMNEVEYITDDGFLFSEPVKNNYVTFNSYRESSLKKINSMIPGSILEVSFQMNVLRQIINKNYYKFQSMVADIGGLLKATFTILTFINSYFSDRLYFHEVIEENINSMQEKKTTSSKIIHIDKQKKASTNFSLVGNIANSHLDLLNFKIENASSKKMMKLNNQEIQTHHKISVANHQLSSQGNKEVDLKLASPQLNIFEKILPVCCFNQKFCSTKGKLDHQNYLNFLLRLLDIKNITKRMNSLDKLSLILTGSENKHILENCINPTFYEDKQQNQIETPMTTEFSEVKNLVLNSISDYILNFYVIEKNSNC